MNALQAGAPTALEPYRPLPGAYPQPAAHGGRPRGDGRLLLPIDPVLERLAGHGSAGERSAGPEAQARTEGDGPRGQDYREPRADRGMHARPAHRRPLHTGPLGSVIGAPPSAGPGEDLLDDALHRVARWLGQGDAALRLAERRLRRQDLQRQVALLADDIRQALAAQRRLRPEEALSVPTADAIFSAAVLGTEPVSPLPGRRPVQATRAGAPGGAQDAFDLSARARALAWLRAFEAQAADRLDLPGRHDGDALAEWAHGGVCFRDEADLVRSVPCALAVRTSPPHGFGGRPVSGPDGPLHLLPDYPAPPGLRCLTAARLGHWPVLVARGRWDGAGGLHKVSISRDHRHFVGTGVYTDEVVEEAKLLMWHRLLGRASGAPAAPASWRAWLGW